MRDGSAGYGVIPIENSLYGSVHENYDHLLKYDFQIVGETTLRVEHALISRSGIELGQIRRAFSHPVALDQCRTFFLSHPQIKPMPFYDTAGSVKMLMQENQADSAAIASEHAASIYGAVVVIRGIQDNQDNFTRFFLLSKQSGSNRETASTEGAWKTSLVFTTPNAPGALARALTCFSGRSLNLTKLESRPMRDRPWEYLFYVDIANAVNDPSVWDALSELKEVTSWLKVLGSYKPTMAD